MAYLGGPFSGALVLATERTSGFVRFHAWQALIGLGLLGLAAVVALVAAFAFLVFSPTAFWVMLWLSASIAVAWVAAWGLCLFHAANGPDLEAAACRQPCRAARYQPSRDRVEVMCAA